METTKKSHPPFFPRSSVLIRHVNIKQIQVKNNNKKITDDNVELNNKINN